jgi:hypothetical protein
MFSSLWFRARHIALGCVLLTPILSAPSAATATNPSLANFPRLVLWAWERPEDLRALGRNVGVAFLAQTISATNVGFVVDPRRQPLRVSPSTPLLDVTRIEVPSSLPQSLSSASASDVASLIAKSATLPQVVGVQIDFDAALSQREFYREVVRDLRGLISPDIPISITALASWCVDDQWVRTLEVDEVVPMLFRMGPTNEPFRAMGASGRWNAAACRSAVGTSLDEPLAVEPGHRRVYVFAPRTWTARSIVAAQRSVR